MGIIWGSQRKRHNDGVYGSNKRSRLMIILEAECWLMMKQC